MSLTDKQKADYERDGFVIYGSYAIRGHLSSPA